MDNVLKNGDLLRNVEACFHQRWSLNCKHRDPLVFQNYLSDGSAVVKDSDGFVKLIRPEKIVIYLKY